MVGAFLVQGGVELVCTTTKVPVPFVVAGG